MRPVRRRIFNPGDDEQGRTVSGERERGSQEDRTVRRLASRIGELETEIRLMAQAIARAPSPADGAPATSSSVQKDARWHCSKCGYLLAFYDLDSDVLRTRYKEHIVYMRIGTDGFVQIVCRGCGEVNTQEYAPEDAVGEGATSTAP